MPIKPEKRSQSLCIPPVDSLLSGAVRRKGEESVGSYVQRDYNSLTFQLDEQAFGRPFEIQST